MKKLILTIATAFTMSTCLANDFSDVNYLPPGGVAADAKTASQLAEIVLKSVYGNKQIDAQLPLTAVLMENGVWQITGTFNLPPGSFGGVATILIRKKDGAVIGMIHGK
ncbi:MAG TPA: NTF2 fold immunity protein [Telluria sp.]